MAELVPLLFIAIAVVFLLVLPMRQRNRAMQQARLLQDSLAVGTEVMTTSGLYGTVVALGDDTIELEISPGVTVRWAKAAVAEVKSAPVAADPDPARADIEPDSV
jgi:preprotein translocase subunit YajC